MKMGKRRRTFKGPPMLQWMAGSGPRFLKGCGRALRGCAPALRSVCWAMASSFTLLGKTFRLRFLGWLRIPLLASVRPTLVALDDRHCIVRVALRRWTRNHFGSMYFGALCIGADCAGGLLAVERIRQRKAGLSLVFKSVRAEFLKRPDADVYFICEEGPRVDALVERALASGEREGEPVQVRGAVRKADGTYETVAEFVLELSLKKTGNAVL